MGTFNSAGVEIAYEVEGEGKPILLIPGLATTSRITWSATGWVQFLSERGRQVVTIDNRGHGPSGRPHDPGADPIEEMVEDTCRLVEHLGQERMDVMGYSMGARIGTLLAIHHRERVDRLVLAGMAAMMMTGGVRAEEYAAAMEVESPDAVSYPQARAFRMFADLTRSDLKTVAACIRVMRHGIPKEELARITAPVLVVAGDGDGEAGPVEPLVAAIPRARGLMLPGRDHMKTLRDPAYKHTVAEFIGN